MLLLGSTLYGKVKNYPACEPALTLIGAHPHMVLESLSRVLISAAFTEVAYGMIFKVNIFTVDVKLTWKHYAFIAIAVWWVCMRSWSLNFSHMTLRRH